MQYTKECSLLTLNSKHYIGNGVYEYQFNPTDFRNSTVTLNLFALYNSLFNIKSNNNTFRIIWIDGTSYNFTIPDGYYEIEDLNAFIEQQCLLKNLYVTKSEGTKDIFFFSFGINPSRYKCQIDVYYVPKNANATSLGYTKPANATWGFPDVDTTPQIELSSGLMRIMEQITQSMYPQSPTNTDVTFLSDILPKLIQSFTIFIACNFCDSKLNLHPRILGQIPIRSEFGKVINIDVNNMAQLNIRPGVYDRVRIELMDQDCKPLQINA